MISRRVGWTFAILAILIFSTNTPVARLAILDGMSPTTLLMGRFTLGAVMLGVTSAGISYRNTGRNTKNKQKPIDRRGIGLCLSSGFINGLALVLFFWGIARLNASIVSILSVVLFQVTTLLLQRIWGEPLTRRRLLRLLLNFVGVYLLLGVSGGIDWWGVLLVTLGSILFSIHIVSVQRYLKPYSVFTTTTLIVTAAAIIVTFLWILEGRDSFVPGVIGWVAIVVQGIVATFIGRLLTYAAIQVVGSSEYALLTPLEVALSVLWSVVFLGEWLLLPQWIGATLILGSIILAAQYQPKRKMVPRKI